MNSGHIVEVVPFNLEKHPNADALGIVRVGGYVVCCNISGWLNSDGSYPTKAAYIKPDSLVPITNEAFTFLAKEANKDGYARIKPKRLRQVWSYGMLVPVPDTFNIGDDVTSYFGVKHYEPEEETENLNAGESCKGPDLLMLPGKYDIEHLKKYYSLLPERVRIDEKVDGSNICVVYANGNFHVKSRTLWKREYQDRSHLNIEYFTSKGKTEEEAKVLVDNINSKPNKRSHFWEGLRINEPLQKFLQDNEGIFVFGELFGNTAKVKYGTNRIAIYDMWSQGNFFDSQKTLELARKYNIEHVPVLMEDTKFDLDAAIELSEGITAVAGAKPNTIREGVVVRPHTEMYSDKIGRVILKNHSPSWLSL